MTKKSHRVNYSKLATHLQELPLEATCLDLIAHLAKFEGCESELLLEILKEAAKNNAKENWISGLLSICEALKRDNPRFMCGMFQDWAMERI